MEERLKLIICWNLWTRSTDPREGNASYSSTLAWKIPWTKEAGRLQSMGSLRMGQDWATSLSLFTFMYWRRKWEPTPCSCLENPRDGGAWLAAVCGVAQSRTQLKRLSSSSSTDPGEPGAKQYLLGLGIIFCMWLSPACCAQDVSCQRHLWNCCPEIL